MSDLDLKSFRKKLGLTQEELAKQLGVNRRTIINYEKGETIPESMAKLLDILVTKSESDAGAVNSLDVKDEYELEYLENKNANQFMRLENGQYLMTMPLAEFNIQAGLLDHYQDIEYMKSLEKHSIIVDEPYKGRYMAFRVKGDSMDDGTSDAIVQNSIVSTRELQQQHWTSRIRFNDFQYWVIYTTQSRFPLLKEIIGHDVEKGVIKCHSLNDAPEYTDFELSLNDVQALFYVVDVSRQLSKKQNY